LNLDRTDWVLIQRYVTGNATTEESHRIEQWMSRNPENEKLIRDLEEIWNLTPEEDFRVDVQKAWNQFQTRNKKGVRPVHLHSAPEKKSFAVYHVFRAAAFILVAVVAGFFFQHISAIQSETDLAADRSQFYTMQELTTDRGEKARVTFSDGTEVTLNSFSSISFPQEFRGSAREVYLEGEAYFKVANNPDQPFIVHAGHANVEVLGTEFNVRGWSSDEVVDVVVREGKVSVRSVEPELAEKAEVILTEGFKTSVLRGQLPLEAQSANVTNNLLWMTGGMHFDNLPFDKVVTELERRFNVEITVADQELLEIPYTGTFQYAELDEVLMVIAAAMEIEYSRDRQEIELRNIFK
jgi:transmembrane sensor